MKPVAGILCAFLVMAIPCFSQKPPQDAHSYYNELHDSGSNWNKGNRFNRVCFGEKRDPREAPDMFDATDSFLLVGLWGESPSSILTQKYSKGVPETVVSLRRDPEGTSWSWLSKLQRIQISISDVGRYHWKATLYDKEGNPIPQTPRFELSSYGKCEVIR